MPEYTDNPRGINLAPSLHIGKAFDSLVITCDFCLTRASPPFFPVPPVALTAHHPPVVFGFFLH